MSNPGSEPRIIDTGSIFESKFPTGAVVEVVASGNAVNRLFDPRDPMAGSSGRVINHNYPFVIIEVFGGKAPVQVPGRNLALVARGLEPCARA